MFRPPEAMTTLAELSAFKSSIIHNLKPRPEIKPKPCLQADALPPLLKPLLIEIVHTLPTYDACVIRTPKQTGYSTETCLASFCDSMQIAEKCCLNWMNLHQIPELHPFFLSHEPPRIIVSSELPDAGISVVFPNIKEGWEFIHEGNWKKRWEGENQETDPSSGVIGLLNQDLEDFPQCFPQAHEELVNFIDQLNTYPTLEDALMSIPDEKLRRVFTKYFDTRKKRLSPGCIPKSDPALEARVIELDNILTKHKIAIDLKGIVIGIRPKKKNSPDLLRYERQVFISNTGRGIRFDVEESRSHSSRAVGLSDHMTWDLVSAAE